VFDNVVWLSGEQLHVKDTELCLNVVELIHDGPKLFDFLKMRQQMRCGRTQNSKLSTYVQDELRNDIFIWQVLIPQVQVC
jgi:hypothetical protein